MRKLLLLPLLAILMATTGCYKDRIETLEGDLAQTKANLTQSDINNAALVAALAERVEDNTEAIADNTSAIADALLAVGANTASIDSITTQALAYAEAQLTLTTGLQTQIDDLKGNVNGILSSVSSLTAEDTAINELIEDLEDDVDDLEDDIRAVGRRIPSVTIGTWTPVFATQTSSFNQTADTFLNGVPAATATRHILVSHSISTVASVTSTVYTGTVSGTTTTVGSHTVTSTASN